jgi:hypothetical protein
MERRFAQGSGASGGGGLSGGGSSEVKLEELSKYFHLPEKSVAKELGICLTSLKKLCRSYGITRWPFRKLKSLERTMKKVQTEEEAVSSQAAGEGGGSDVRRKPYTVGNKTVFLSDEELDVFKMTMGKQATHELKPASLETLEPSLFNQVCTLTLHTLHPTSSNRRASRPSSLRCLIRFAR